MFPHDEYHIYTTNDRLERNYVYLGGAILDEAERLANNTYTEVDDRWDHIHRLDVGSNIYLTVESGSRSPSLQSRGYEGWMPVECGDFDDPVFFDSMIFHKCINEHDFVDEPEWSYNEVREWVNYEHRPQFEEEFDDYLTTHYDPSEVEVDW